MVAEVLGTCGKCLLILSIFLVKQEANPSLAERVKIGGGEVKSLRRKFFLKPSTEFYLNFYQLGASSLLSS